MQSLVLPPSFVASDFGHLRYPYSERHLLDRPRSANARRCTPRDLPLPHSMSSSGPAEDPLETLGNARRLGHLDLPKPVTTAAATATTVGASSETLSTAPGSTLSAASPHLGAAREPPLQHIATGPTDETLRPPLIFGDAFSASRFPPTFTGQPSSGPSTVTYQQPTFGAATAGPGSRVLPQKTTRRTKSHVASACVNCKKKHLGCDPARPCRRCVLSGKADTCVDVTHKKRGRPPLKADEGSIRTYGSQLDRSAPGDQGPARRPMHRATSSRELRPMTDLQMPGAQPTIMGARMAPGQQHPWPIAYPHPHSIDPSLTQRTMGHRRFSSSGSGQSLTAVSPTGYVAMPAGYNPALAAGGRMPAVGRPYPPGMHPTPSPPQYHQPYSVPISPYADARVANRIPMSETPVPVPAPAPAPREPREGYAETPVRLPPIYPSPVIHPQSLPQPQPQPQPHRTNEPYPATWSPQQIHGPHQHAGFVEPISPSNQMRQPGPDVGQPSQGLGLVSPGEPSQQTSSARTRTYDEQRERETDEGDSSKPAKRRKMALDDMVND
ncbi:hypothetical protein BDV18DRAFT_138178 [Aspergillus unguis]